MQIKKLSERIPIRGSNIYDEPLFKEMLMKHLPTLLTHRTGTISITQFEADNYVGDFHGLLSVKLIQPHQWWLFTILNGLNCSTDFKGDFLDIRTPDEDYLEKLIDIYRTTHK